MSLKVETNRKKEVVAKERAPKVEVLGKMGELMRGKNGGSDRKPAARQS